MKKLLLVGLLLGGVSVYAAEGGGRPLGLVASKCRKCGKYKGPEFGARACQCGQPAAAAPARPAVAPSNSTSQSRPTAAATDDAGRRVQELRQNEDSRLAAPAAAQAAATQATAIPALAATEIDRETQDLIAGMFEEDLDALQALKVEYDAAVAKLLAAQERLQADREMQSLIDADAAYARFLAQEEGAQQNTDGDAELARAMEMSFREK